MTVVTGARLMASVRDVAAISIARDQDRFLDRVKRAPPIIRPEGLFHVPLGPFLALRQRGILHLPRGECQSPALIEVLCVAVPP